MGPRKRKNNALFKIWEDKIYVWYFPIRPIFKNTPSYTTLK